MRPSCSTSSPTGCKVHLREQGARHDLIDAVFALGGEDDLVQRGDAGRGAGPVPRQRRRREPARRLRRAANILKIEEKKDGRRYAGVPNKSLLVLAEEKALAAAIAAAEAQASEAALKRGFRGGDAGDRQAARAGRRIFRQGHGQRRRPELRENRLRLLSRIRDATLAVADFSKIERTDDDV